MGAYRNEPTDRGWGGARADAFKGISKGKGVHGML